MKNDTYYFPHDYNATQDSKIIQLLNECGLQGLGAYWIIVELLHQQPTGKIPKEVFKAHIKMYYSMDDRGTSDLDNICSTLVQTELVVEKDGFIYSERVFDNKRHRDNISNARSIAGKASANKRLRTNVEQPIEQMSTIERKGKENKEVKRETPDLASVKDFFKNDIMAANFFDYYQANGWRVGKNLMKDWEAAARNWKRRQGEFSTNKPQTGWVKP